MKKHETNREKVENTIHLLDAIELYTQESRELLYRILGEMDAARDFANINQKKFVMVKGGKN